MAISRYLSMKRLSILLVALFVIGVGGAMIFDRYWLAPGDACEAKGNWYDIESRTCATPVYVPDITGRPAGQSRADASNAKNRELLKLEAEVKRQEAVIAADAARQRENLEKARPKY